MDALFLHELDVDEMRLGAIRLPKGVGIVISELLDPVADFCGGKGPDCLRPDLATSLVVGGWGRAVDEG